MDKLTAAQPENPQNKRTNATAPVWGGRPGNLLVSYWCKLMFSSWGAWVNTSQAVQVGKVHCSTRVEHFRVWLLALLTWQGLELPWIQTFGNVHEEFSTFGSLRWDDPPKWWMAPVHGCIKRGQLSTSMWLSASVFCCYTFSSGIDCVPSNCKSTEILHSVVFVSYMLQQWEEQLMQWACSCYGFTGKCTLKGHMFEYLVPSCWSCFVSLWNF